MATIMNAKRPATVNLKGLIPLQNFQLEKAYGTWYQQLRLDTKSGKAPMGQNETNVVMTLAPNPNAKTNKSWPLQIQKTSEVPTTTGNLKEFVTAEQIKNQFNKFGQTAKMDFEKFGTAFGNLAQQVPSGISGMLANPSSIGTALPGLATNVADQLKLAFGGAAPPNGMPNGMPSNNGIAALASAKNGSTYPATKSKTVEYNAKPTSIPAVWDVELLNWLPFLTSKLVVLDAGFASTNPSNITQAYDYLVIGNPNKSILNVYTRTPAYDSNLAAGFAAIAAKNKYPADAANRMFVISHVA